MHLRNGQACSQDEPMSGKGVNGGAVHQDPRSPAFRMGRRLISVPSCGPDDSQTPGPTIMESRLLVLLARGLTDDAAARRLNISVRTERRMMANLMRRLAATSRFEAGAKAVQRGWI